ncbi:MAG: gliding motility-associated ABC transporter substrate-binding protein GldG [Flavobacteriales bacterium]|nr:gliding motility-associated ABC transporter substrate-binding protein GldG [Flavobacteriales bacterium]NUM51877.1 gliding motility-associated ABC transporter substrate-binding protein GldG [Flavobacteriales bacterium]
MKQNKKNDIAKVVATFAVLLLLNYVSSFWFLRLDLTQEKRYTLSDATKKILKNLDDVVYFKIYLEGEFPAGFKKLRNETREMLNEFKAYAGKKIEYEFINPSASSDKKTREDIYRQLYKQGLLPTDLSVKEDDGISNKIIWPGAILSYKNKEIPLQLLKSQMGVPPEQIVNGSVESLEYELINGINKITQPNVMKVAFIEGHGELNSLQTADIAKTLAEYYVVDRITLNGQLSTLTERAENDSGNFIVKRKYETLIIAKPTNAFSENDKFIIDQHLMYGGKILYLIDPVFAEMDSLETSEFTMAIPIDLKLDDQLFTYGARINFTLVQDLQAAPIPVVTGRIGTQIKTEMFPWLFFPLFMPSASHPIINNLNAVKGEFVSTIDTIAKPEIKKTVLLQSSRYTKILNAPVRISLGMLRIEPNMQQFNKPLQPVAVLLEGKFNSVFENRIPKSVENSKEIAFKNKSVNTKIIVVGDGDLIKNHVKKTGNEYLPLGYDRFTKQQYGNKDFILNCVNFLCDDNGLMEVRSRKLTLRLLDQALIKEQRTKWQTLNLLLPVLIVIAFGITQYIIRKKRYTQ